jgi:flagellar biosynthesis/type III secretory pathway protein FliH
VLKEAVTTIEKFEYPLSGMTASCSWQHVVSIDTGIVVGDSSKASSAAPQAKVSSEDFAIAFERGRKEGIEEGRRVERIEQAARLEQIENWRKEQVATMSDKFALERNDLLRAIEPEVVKLALRVAERIVRRELLIDPLMLTGAVRAALGQLVDKSMVRLRVPAEDADLWTETVAHLPNLRIKPEIVADTQLRQGECELESNCGVADLSVASQLREIARSFLGREGLASGSDGSSGQAEAEADL